MILDKKATSEKIIKHVQNTQGMIMDVDKFKKKISSVEDFKEACEFCGISPIYNKE